MEMSRFSCRLCLSVSDFNVSLFGSYCRKTNMVDKILVSLKLVIEESDQLPTICYKCAESVERFYDFIGFIKKSQMNYCSINKLNPKGLNVEPQNGANRRCVTSYVRGQVSEADYTFSFLEVSRIEEKQESKSSSPFFSYVSPPNFEHRRPESSEWKTPLPGCHGIQKLKRKSQLETSNKIERPRQHSMDLFASQSQEAEEAKPALEWVFTPGKKAMRKVREQCFGPSEF